MLRNEGYPCFYCGVGTARHDSSTFYVTTATNWKNEPESVLMQAQFRLCEVCHYMEHERKDVSFRRELSTLAAARAPHES